jgi:hypothetical protein
MVARPALEWAMQTCQYCSSTDSHAESSRPETAIKAKCALLVFVIEEKTKLSWLPRSILTVKIADFARLMWLLFCLESEAGCLVIGGAPLAFGRTTLVHFCFACNAACFFLKTNSK